jgi:ATP-binding cassette subfamily C (CFTR/MRP) protein 1
MDALGNILIFGIAIASVTFGKEANPAKLGVVLTYALSIVGGSETLSTRLLH